MEAVRERTTMTKDVRARDTKRGATLVAALEHADFERHCSIDGEYNDRCPEAE